MHPFRRSTVRRSSVLTAVVLVAALASAATAHAAPWRNFTGDTQTNLTTVQMVRASETGPLHVVWAGPGTDANSTNQLLQRDVLPSGALGPTRVLHTVPHPAGFNSPAIARNPLDGRLWVFGASAGGFEGRMFALSSADGLQSITAATPISTSGYAYAPDNASAVFTPDGSAFQTFGRTLKRTLDVDPAEDDLGVAPGIDTGNGPLCCTYWSQLAADSVSGETFVGWFSNVDPNRAGIEVVSVASGAVAYAPGSADTGRRSSANGDGPTPITGRIGAAGVYAGYCGGYPTCTSVQVWRVGAAKPVVAATAKELDHVRITSAPGGKLWAFWYSKGEIWARRSNATVTAFGEPVRVRVPGYRAADLWRLAGDGAAGYLDVFAALGFGGTDTTYTTRVLPGLTLVGPAATMTDSILSLRVLDAGVPVPGAKVSYRGVSATTDAKGKAFLTVKGNPGTAFAFASRPGFTADKVRIRVA